MNFDELCRFELKRGNHKRSEDGLCVLEAVAWFAGELHSDHPRCVCPLIAHYCRSLNDRLDDRRQDLVPYIPRLVNTLDGKDAFRSRLQILLAEYLAVGGSRHLAHRMETRFAKAQVPHYLSSFGLAVLCDAITLKRRAPYAIEILDRLLSTGSRSAGPSAEASARAKDLDAVPVA